VGPGLELTLNQVAALGGLTGFIERRTRANTRFFALEAERLARLCQSVAMRFSRGGRLITVGASPAARSDARRVAVGFVHPAIVGRRALPAIALTREWGDLRLQIELFAEPDDMVIGFEAEHDPATAAALEFARERGSLTIAFERVGAEWEFIPPTADAFVRQELVETLYNVVWELVGVFFEHHGFLARRESRPAGDAGGSRFRRPSPAEPDLDVKAVLDDVRRSILMKSEEVGELRERTLIESGTQIETAARALRQTFDMGGQLLVMGSGGSATDAMDLVADFRAAPQGWPARRAIDLTEDAGILTAIASDIGPDAIFARQVIAHGRRGDALVALSTNDSRSVTFALEEARRRGLHTIAILRDDGDRATAEGLADHLVITRSDNVLRVQEVQASVCHVLRELVEWAGMDPSEGG
jgi:D-sedoheptulose 7-phosphate isomerase